MFIGRHEQIEALSQLWNKRTSSLVTCRGRRRIGKSTLIEEFARRTADCFINIVGLPPRKGMTDVAQRRNFCEELAEQIGSGVAPAKNWTMAFKSLDEATAFLQDPYLGGNLLEICHALTALKTNNATEVFGRPDDVKLKSSMTLFSLVPDADPVFQNILDKYYGGKRDRRTLKILGVL